MREYRLICGVLLLPALTLIAGANFVRDKSLVPITRVGLSKPREDVRASLTIKLRQSGKGAVLDETGIDRSAYQGTVADASLDAEIEALGLEYASPTDLPIIRLAPWQDPAALVKSNPMTAEVEGAPLEPGRLHALRKVLRDGEALQSRRDQETLRVVARTTLQERYSRRTKAINRLWSGKSNLWYSPPKRDQGNARLFGIEFSSGLNVAWPVMLESSPNPTLAIPSGPYLELESIPLDQALRSLSREKQLDIQFESNFPFGKRVTVIGLQGQSDQLFQAVLMLFDLSASRTKNTIRIGQRSTERDLLRQRIRVQCFHRAERRSRELIWSLESKQSVQPQREMRKTVNALSETEKRLLEDAASSQLYGQAAVAMLLWDDPRLGTGRVRVSADPRADIILQADAEAIPLTGL